MAMKVTQIDEKWFLDWGARIGAAARMEDIKGSQLENLIAVLDSIEGRESLLVAATYALRQAQRLGRGRTTARLASQALCELYKMGGGKEEARRMLGVAKWVYEAVQRFRGDPSRLSLENLLSQLAGSSTSGR